MRLSTAPFSPAPRAAPTPCAHAAAASTESSSHAGSERASQEQCSAPSSRRGTSKASDARASAGVRIRAAYRRYGRGPIRARSASNALTRRRRSDRNNAEASTT